MKFQKEREEYFKSILENFEDGKYQTSDLKKSLLDKEGGKLYKYYDFDSFFDNESKLKSFNDGKLWASIPAEFNDPYDCLIQVFLKRGNFLNPYEFLQQEVEGIQIDDDNISEEKKRDMEQQINNLFKSLSPEEFDKLCRDNDIDFQNIFYDKKLANFWKDKYYVVCLTSNLRSILMWSHYAKNHTGFCLEFDPHEITFNLENHIRKIVNEGDHNRTLAEEKKKEIIEQLTRESYRKVDDIYPVCYFKDLLKYRDLLTAKTIRWASLLKHQDWSYENEWRIVYPKEGDGVPEDRNFFEAYPSAIYLGCEFKESGEKQKKFLKTIEEKKIKIFKMYLKNDFTLECRLLKG